MNTGLRRRHRLMWSILALAIPAVLVAAIAFRKTTPTQEIIPARSQPGGTIEKEYPDLWKKSPIRTVMLRDAEGSILELTPEDLLLPDVLVYWTPGSVTDSIPDNAVLLGSLAGQRPQRFRMPTGVSGGNLVLYSLAHMSIHESAALPGGNP